MECLGKKHAKTGRDAESIGGSVGSILLPRFVGQRLSVFFRFQHGQTVCGLRRWPVKEVKKTLQVFTKTCSLQLIGRSRKEQADGCCFDRYGSIPASILGGNKQADAGASILLQQRPWKEYDTGGDAGILLCVFLFLGNHLCAGQRLLRLSRINSSESIQVCWSTCRNNGQWPNTTDECRTNTQGFGL